MGLVLHRQERRAGRHSACPSRPISDMILVMLTPGEVVTGLVSGSVLIAFGLVPGLFDRLSEGVRNFSNSLTSPFHHHHARRHEPIQPPMGLAILGGALILLTLLGYLAGPF
uniref:Uncharacterized protein n=1 Tax=Solibacter usitatus (strain Ellin6076) TaxID=234267 RepID=Q021Z9_SOLUE